MYYVQSSQNLFESNIEDIFQVKKNKNCQEAVQLVKGS